MSGALLSIGGLMFLIPLVTLTGIAAVGEIPSTILQVGGWSMALAAIVAAIGAFMRLHE